MMTIMIMMTSMESNDGFEFSKNINRKQDARVDLEGGKGGKKSLRKGDVRKAAAPQTQCVALKCTGITFIQIQISVYVYK